MQGPGDLFKKQIGPIGKGIRVMLDSLKENGTYSSKRINRLFVVGTLLILTVADSAAHDWVLRLEVLLAWLTFVGFETRQTTVEKMKQISNNNQPNNFNQINEEKQK